MQHILPLEEGLPKFLQGMQLQSRLEGLEESLFVSEFTSKEELRAISNRDRYLGEILRTAPKSWNSALAEQIELITIAATIEVNGLRQSFIQPLSAHTVQEAFELKERSGLFSKILEDILVSNGSQTANGSLYIAFAIASKAALVAFLVLVLWFTSLGYVFGSYRGTFIGKVLVTIAVQVLVWPISLLGYVLFRKKR
jgi:hypothetical protein